MALDGDLEECVRNILCGLGDAALSPVKALLSAHVAILTAVVGQARAALLLLDIALTPLLLIQTAANLAIDTARGILSALPSVEGCIDIADLNRIIGEFTEKDITAPIQSWIDELTLKIAERERISAYIDQVDAEIDKVQAVIAAISFCPEETV